MLSAIRRRITPSAVIAMLALVFAMSGGAYAAGRYLITSTKQISPKVLGSLQGKAGKVGKTGANGAPGAAGPAGPAGAQGAAGAQGSAGPAGSNGENGTSVTSATIPKTSATCSKQGGTEFTSASGKAAACNGKEGSPWTAGGTLPSGKTETGVWSIGPLEKPSGTAYVPVASFPIPLAAPLAEGHAHFINTSGMEVNLSEEEVAPTDCGSAIGPEVNASNPQAKAGALCVYASQMQGVFTETELLSAPGAAGAGRAGTMGAFALVGLQGGLEEGHGTWAVTAE
jgi:hypothetical protein